MSSLNEKTKEKIRAALAGQTSGLMKTEIRERAGIKDSVACRVALQHMVKAGEVVGHLGETKQRSRYSLAPSFAGAEVPSRRAKKKRGPKPGKKRAARNARERVSPAAKASDHIAAMTADSELVFIRAEGEQFIFTAEETVAIATLCKANFR